MTESCLSCKFFVPKPVAGGLKNSNYTDGWCKRFPPCPNFVSIRNGANSWCGEYSKGKAPAQDTN